MSDTEHWKGTLTPIGMTGDVNNTAKLILEGQGIEIDTTYDNHEEQLHDIYYKDYVTLDGKLYHVEKKKQDLYSDIMDLTKTKMGFAFEVKYYNGGCGFHEAVEESFERFQKKNDQTPEGE